MLDLDIARSGYKFLLAALALTLPAITPVFAKDRAASGTAVEEALKEPDANRRIEIELEKINPEQAWRQAGYSSTQKARIYRALYNHRLVNDGVVSTDFHSYQLRNAVERYQASRGESRTGFLTRAQVHALLAKPGRATPWERNPGLKEEVRAKIFNRDAASADKETWQRLALSKEKKTALYRALYERGYLNDPKPVTDFLNRMELIQAVAYFQREAGQPVSGYLSDLEVKILLRRNADQTPFELQEAVFEKYGAEPVTEYLSQLATQLLERAPVVDANLAPSLQHLDRPDELPANEKKIKAWNRIARSSTAEYGENWNFKLDVTQLQSHLGLPATGYVSEELFERTTSLELKVKLGETVSFFDMLTPSRLSSVKDWSRWKVEQFDRCEIATSALQLEGFNGSERAPSVHFMRGSDWPRNQLSWNLVLPNWDNSAPARVQVANREYFVGGKEFEPRFVAKDGSELPKNNNVFGEFVNALLKANAFEIGYLTAFGTTVHADFSALGLTKQLRGIQRKC